MAKLFNLARMTTATTGTGTITLGTAVSGYLTFAAAGVANGDVVDYAIKDGSNSEHGTGTYTSSGTTLTRTPTKSTNGNALINLSGTAEVFISPRAETLNDGSLLTTGTVSDARLSGNVPLKNAANVFTNNNLFSGGQLTASSSFVVNGGTLTSSVSNAFNYSSANSGVHQFTTNGGAGSNVAAMPLTGMPFWFVSSDAGSAGSAGFSLHRAGAYAINVGLDSSNSFVIGGWSDVIGTRFRVDPNGNVVAQTFWAAGINPYAAGGVGALNTAKALVRFNGNGGASVNTSYNVSSVVRNGFGDYTVNFTNAMADTNYLALVTISENDAAATGYGCCPRVVTVATTGYRFLTVRGTNGSNVVVLATDNAYCNVAVFR